MVHRRVKTGLAWLHHVPGRYKDGANASAVPWLPLKKEFLLSLGRLGLAVDTRTGSGHTDSFHGTRSRRSCKGVERLVCTSTRGTHRLGSFSSQNKIQFKKNTDYPETVTGLSGRMSDLLSLQVFITRLDEHLSKMFMLPGRSKDTEERQFLRERTQGLIS